MINIDKKNKWALVQCLREAFEKEIGKISLDEGMQHPLSSSSYSSSSSSREIPQYRMTLTIEAEHVHRVILEATGNLMQKELSDARLRIEQMKVKIKELEEKLQSQENCESVHPNSNVDLSPRCEVCTRKLGSLVNYTESGVNRSAILCDDCVNKIASHSNVKIVSRW